MIWADSAEPEQGALVWPGKRQIDGLQGAGTESSWLSPFDDGGDDVGRETCQRCKLAQPGAAATVLGRDAGDRLVGLGEDQLARRVGFNKQRDQLLVAASRHDVEVVRGEMTLAELAQQFDVHPNQITTWRSQLLEGAAGVFGSEGRAEREEPAIDVKMLHAKIGELTLVNDFCPGRSAQSPEKWAGLWPSAKR